MVSGRDPWDVTVRGTDDDIIRISRFGAAPAAGAAARGCRPGQAGVACEVCDHVVVLREVRESVLTGTTFLSCIACADHGAEPRDVVEEVVRLAGSAGPLAGSDGAGLAVWVPCARCDARGCERCDGGGSYRAAAQHYSALRLGQLVLGRGAVADRRD